MNGTLGSIGVFREDNRSSNSLSVDNHKMVWKEVKPLNIAMTAQGIAVRGAYE